MTEIRETSLRGSRKGYASLAHKEVAKVSILNVDVDCVNFNETLQQIQAWIEAPPLRAASSLECTRQICTVNPEFIVDAWRNTEFADVLSQADLCVADGIGILFAARLFGVSIGERVTGSDGIYRISERAAVRGWRVFLLGAAPGVADEAASVLRQNYPELAVVGTYSSSPSDEDWPLIRERLAEARADILFVAFGHPRQDLWIAAHNDELNAKVAIGVGGAFDFVAGVRPRAPRWMRRVGLEWLYRLLRQPSRAGRMIKLPVFVGLVLRDRFVTLLHLG